MSDGRTLWYPQDARWLSWDAVIDLGEEFGPAAVAVLVCVTSEAKLQGSSWRVKVGLRTVARDAFVRDVDLVRSIVERAGEAGLLDDVVFEDRTVTCRVSGMAASEKRARAAARQQAARDRREADEQGAVTESHAAQRSVTERDDTLPTEQHRTGEDRETTDVVSHKPGERKPSRTVDQEQLPDDLTPELAATAPAVLARLVDLWRQRGGNEPTLRGVGLILRRFPDRDHLSVVGELEHWALAGRGQRRAVKDWTATLGTFLGGAAAGRPVVMPAAPPVAGDRWRTMTDKPAGVPA